MIGKMDTKEAAEGLSEMVEQYGTDSDSSAMEDSFGAELEPRARCYTWPVPQFGVTTSTNVPIAADGRPQQQQTLLNFPIGAGSSASSSQYPSLSNIGSGCIRTASSSTVAPQPCDPLQFAPFPSNTPYNVAGSSINFQPQLLQSSAAAVCQDSLIKQKRVRRRTADSTNPTQSNKKPNPWGEESYSDLIARALANAVDGRLKLNEIYQWFSDNVPYFSQRSSQEEAQGWKV